MVKTVHHFLKFQSVIIEIPLPSSSTVKKMSAVQSQHNCETPMTSSHCNKTYILNISCEDKNLLILTALVRAGLY